MSLLAAYQKVAGQTGTWRARGSSHDEYGFPSFGSAVSIDLIFSLKQTKILNAKGEEDTSQAQALVSEAVGVGDLITYNSIEYVVKAIDDAPPIITSDTLRTVYF